MMAVNDLCLKVRDNYSLDMRSLHLVKFFKGVNALEINDLAWDPFFDGVNDSQIL